MQRQTASQLLGVQDRHSFYDVDRAVITWGRSLVPITFYVLSMTMTFYANTAEILMARGVVSFTSDVTKTNLWVRLSTHSREIRYSGENP